MNATLSKKEIRYNLETALINEIEKMEGTESSKKLKRAVRKFSKDIALKVKFDMKKRFRKEKKTMKLQNELNGFLMEPLSEENKNASGLK